MRAGNGLADATEPSEDEEDQEEEAQVKLMLVVLSQDAIMGFHQQVSVPCQMQHVTVHTSDACSLLCTIKLFLVSGKNKSQPVC